MKLTLLLSKALTALEDAHNNTNPINEEEVTIQDIKIENTVLKRR